MDNEWGGIRGKRRVGFERVESIRVERVEMPLHRRVVHGGLLEERLLILGG